MNILNYRDFLNHRKSQYDFFKESLDASASGWGRVQYSSMNEGLGIQDERVTIDFSNDSPTDLVKLNPPTMVRPVERVGVPVYRGFVMQNRGDRGDFMEAIKKEGSISQEDLERLIAMTFPKELAERKVKILFTAGSSDPLAVSVAEAIRSLYYRDAIIVDVLKKYYGADYQDIVDWDAYEAADPRTRAMLDAYLRRIAPDFKGYIKKSAGLQSGARRLLKPGHEIDQYVIGKMKGAEEEWRKKFLSDRSINPSVAFKFKPAYLFVDDVIIEGSTLRGIFKEMMKTVSAGELDTSVRQMMRGSIYGYCLLSYTKEFDRN